MGTDLNVQELFKAKNQVLDNILSNLKNWDGEIITGIDLIESNQEYLDELRDLNEKLNESEATSTYDEEYEYKLSLIIEEQRKLTQSLKEKQDGLKDNMEQIKKKDKVINSYMNTDKEPIFINKEL